MLKILTIDFDKMKNFANRKESVHLTKTALERRLQHSKMHFKTIFVNTQN